MTSIIVSFIMGYLITKLIIDYGLPRKVLKRFRGLFRKPTISLEIKYLHSFGLPDEIMRAVEKVKSSRDDVTIVIRSLSFYSATNAFPYVVISHDWVPVKEVHGMEASIKEVEKFIVLN